MISNIRAALAVAAVCALSTSAVAGPSDPDAQASAGHYHLYRTPEMWRKLGGLPQPDTSGPNTMEYYGGTVFSSVKVVTVLWGPGVKSGVVSVLPGFFSAITNSTFLDQLKEYSTNGVAAVDGKVGTQTIGRGTFVNQVQITPKNTKHTLTDQQVASELEYQLSIRSLPSRDANTLYMIYFPSGYSIRLAGGQSCVSFGGYHNASFSKGGTVQNPKAAYYAVIPDCGQNVSETEIVSAHELAESITDNIPTPGSSPAFPQAWNTTTGYEIGDLCEAYTGTLGAGNETYSVQQIWLNSLYSCSKGNYTSP